jgi:sigma-54 specific flagellar transcriptional regulator A
MKSSGMMTVPGAFMPTGQSLAIRRVNRLIQQVAGFDSNVLILGESGTGKEVVARAIHELSARRLRPFVAINCGAIPSELLESELFGHEKGAFTGALNLRRGRFELAEGGTIFLDEIGDMNPTMQVKLLRVLQERVFERVGATSSQRCDVRIIAATHRNLEECIAKGSFREDLYYRLNVVPVEMPPLRERCDDLPELIASLSERVRATHGQATQLLPATLAALQQYRWPGNVRELANLLERLGVQCGGQAVDVCDLPSRYQPAGYTPPVEAPERVAATLSVVTTDPLAELKNLATGDELQPADLSEPAVAELLQGAAAAEGMAELPVGGMDLRAYLENLERGLICKALEAANGTVAQAARLLGLRRTTLVEKLRKYGLAAGDLSATGT